MLRNGGLSKAVSRFQYSGHGVDPKRQAEPHAHCTTVSRDNRYVLINDLGLDRISVYHLDPLTARLTPNIPLLRGAARLGSTKSCLSSQRTVGVLPQRDGQHSRRLAWDPEQGTLSRIQNISTLPEGFTGSNTGATVAVDSEGRFVYASNRGDNSVAVFSVSDGQGTIKPVQHVDCGGKSPRHFALDPGNQWLLVANQDSSNIVVFARNSRTGLFDAKRQPIPAELSRLPALPLSRAITRTCRSWYRSRNKRRLTYPMSRMPVEPLLHAGKPTLKLLRKLCDPTLFRTRSTDSRRS